MNGLMNEWIDRWKDVWIDAEMDVWIDRWKDLWIDARNGCMGRWRIVEIRRIDRCINE